MQRFNCTAPTSLQELCMNTTSPLPGLFSVSAIRAHCSAHTPLYCAQEQYMYMHMYTYTHTTTYVRTHNLRTVQYTSADLITFPRNSGGTLIPPTFTTGRHDRRWHSSDWLPLTSVKRIGHYVFLRRWWTFRLSLQPLLLHLPICLCDLTQIFFLPGQKVNFVIFVCKNVCICLLVILQW